MIRNDLSRANRTVVLLPRLPGTHPSYTFRRYRPILSFSVSPSYSRAWRRRRRLKISHCKSSIVAIRPHVLPCTLDDQAVSAKPPYLLIICLAARSSISFAHFLVHRTHWIFFINSNNSIRYSLRNSISLEVWLRSWKLHTRYSTGEFSRTFCKLLRIMFAWYSSNCRRTIW